jgi:hypothetical protein
MNSKNASLIIGIIFLAVGFLGYTSNPVISDSHEALFHADSTHNIVHLVSGALFILIALAATAYASLFMKIFGLVYLVLGVWGAAVIGSEGSTTLLGFLHVNGADNYLHIALGIIIFLAGLLKPAAITRR